MAATAAVQALVIMGVSGSGKTTVGELLAKTLDCKFFDADNFHSLENKEKMQKMIPLTDEDRIPWLETLQDLMICHIIQGERIVLACSALRKAYRDILRSADLEFAMRNDDSWKEKHVNFKDHNTKSGWMDESLNVCDVNAYERKVVFIYLRGTVDLFAARVEARHHKGIHYMPPSLLLSQIDTLEHTTEEDDIITVDASLQPEKIVGFILCSLPTIGQASPIIKSS